MTPETVTSLLFIFRVFERVIAVCFGGLAVYLGYRLFLHLPDKADSEGELVMPGNVSIYLSRIGPGVFFAVLGLVVASLSIYQGVEFEQTLSSGSSVRISGAGQTEQPSELPIVSERNEVRQLLFTLNITLPETRRDDISPQQQAELELAIPRIKLLLMQMVWDEAWGDYQTFARWVEDGAFDEPPEGTLKAYEFYKEGSE